MSYDSEFESNVAAIFNHCGYSQEEAMECWPVHATKEGIVIGKQHGLSAPGAAVIAFCQALLTNCEQGRLTARKARADLDSLIAWAGTHYPELMARTVGATIKTRERLLMMPKREPEAAFDSHQNAQLAVNQ